MAKSEYRELLDLYFIPRAILSSIVANWNLRERDDVGGIGGESLIEP
jgi:hypothetical protein